jgi:hypothetical protein
VFRIDAENAATAAEKPAPKLPALWSTVWSIRHRERAQVIGHGIDGCFYLNGHTQCYWVANKGKTWTDTPAETRRPKVGDQVWVRDSDNEHNPLEKRTISSFHEIEDSFFVGNWYMPRNIFDHGKTWIYADEPLSSFINKEEK